MRSVVEKIRTGVYLQDEVFEVMPMAGARPRSGARSHPVCDAAITGAALVKHMDDVRFASLRALRQMLRALQAERVAIGYVDAAAAQMTEELVWTGGFGRCGESERELRCTEFAEELQSWLATHGRSLEIDIDAHGSAWHEWPCDRLAFVRGSDDEHRNGVLVLAIQWRGNESLPEGADLDIALFLQEYALRHKQLKS